MNNDTKLFEIGFTRYTTFTLKQHARSLEAAHEIAKRVDKLPTGASIEAEWCEIGDIYEIVESEPEAVSDFYQSIIDPVHTEGDSTNQDTWIRTGQCLPKSAQLILWFSLEEGIQMGFYSDQKKCFYSIDSTVKPQSPGYATYEVSHWTQLPKEPQCDYPPDHFRDATK